MAINRQGLLKFFKIIVFTILALTPTLTKAQCPTVDFTFQQDSICLGESISLNNFSINTDNYTWDFCGGDLLNSPYGEIVTTILNSSTPVGLEFAQDSGDWFGFIVSRDNNKIFRLDFGNNLNNQPIINDLGNIGNLLDRPQTIKLKKNNNNWIGFVQNLNTNELVRINFGTSLSENYPTVDVILNTNGVVNNGFDIAYDGSNWVIVIGKGNSITLVNLGGNLMNTLSPSDIIAGTSISGANNISDVSLTKKNGKWHGFITCFGNKSIHRLDFGNALFTLPATTQLSNSFLGSDIPYGLEVEYEDTLMVAHIVTLSGNLYRSYITDPYLDITGELIGKLGVLSNTIKLAMVKQESQWQGFTINYSSKQLYRISFPDDCIANNSTSQLYIPQEIYYSSPGKKIIELVGTNDEGCVEQKVKNIFVKNATSPSISFTTENACISNPNTFSASSSDDASITSWSWDFGDGSGTATGQNVEYQFLNKGNYQINLSIEATNGCSNTSKQLLSIYDTPQAGFTYESGIICSNNPMELTNSSVFNGPDSVLTYSWNMDDEATIIEINPSYTFSSGGDKNIMLTASIPGCSSQISEVVNITPGPLTNFSFDDQCLFDTFTFTNSTTGVNITGYQWDFGDGYTSSNTSPSHQYNEGGTYVVSLTASNALGCHTILQKVANARYTPDVDFTYDLACSDNSVTFYDRSAVAEANITEQYWYLNNPALNYNKEGTGPSPSFDLGSEGNYIMTLIAESNYGCRDTLIRDDVRVRPSPVGDFTFENICFGDSTQFIPDIELPEDEEISSINWLIDDQFYSQNEVKYKYPDFGTDSVDLYVRASNYCTGMIRKGVNILPLPEAEIMLSSFCADQPVAISATVNSADPVSNYIWKINDKPLSTNQGFEYVFRDSDEYDVSLAVTTLNKCMITTSETFTIHPSPTSAFDIFPSIGANPLSVQFTDRSSGATGIKYDFSVNNDDKSSEHDPAYVYQTLGKDYPYQVVWNNFGCADTSYVEVEVVVPVLDISIADVSMEVVNDRLKLFVELFNNGTIIINNPNIRIDIDRKISVSQIVECKLMPGDSKKYEIDFDVLVKNEQLSYICFALETKIGAYSDVNPYDNSQCLSIENTFIVLEPYPNPSHSFVELPIILPAAGNCEIKMLGENGMLAFSREFKNMNQGLNVVKVDLSTYRQGLYLIHVSHEDFETTKKIVIR